MKEMLTKFKMELREELKEDFKKELSQKIQKVEEKIDAVKIELLGKNEDLKAENEEIKKTLTEIKNENLELKGQIAEMEQYSKRNNVIIKGIHMEPNENLKEKVKAVSQKLGTPLEEHDFCTVHRLSNKGPAPAIVAKLNNRDKANSLIKQSKNKRIWGKDIGQTPSEPIIVSEHLTKSKKEIFEAARNLKAQGKVKFVWVKNTEIYIREREETPATKIKGIEQIEEYLRTSRKRALHDRSPQQEQDESIRDGTNPNKKSTIARRNGKIEDYYKQ